MRNVHEYDGKVVVTLAKSFSTKEKTLAFETLRLKLRDTRAKHMVDLIMGDMTNTNGENQDEKNVADASDVLMELCQMVEEEVEPFIEEQLADIRNGRCPQGRTVRLWQCVSALRE